MVTLPSRDPDPRLLALVEGVLRRASVPGSKHDEARQDFLDHLQTAIDRRVAAGTEVEAAIAAAIADFGQPNDVGGALEASTQSMMILHRIPYDLLSAVRTLWRRPMISAAAIATLALGIGVNGAVFSVVDWVLLRPLPYPAAEELVRLQTAGTDPVTSPAALTHTELAALHSSTAFASAVGFSTATRVVAAPGIDPAHVVLARISGDISKTFRSFPDVGRTFTSDEMSAGAPLVVLSHSLWERQFLRDPQISGKVISIDGVPHTVVGVMPQGRGYPPEADVWRPITSEEREDDDRDLGVVARLRPGRSLISANAELSALASPAGGQRTTWAEAMQQTEVKDVERALTALLVAAMLILLIACANVAALIAASGSDRGAEIAVREALGASRAQLIGQLLTESVVLALAGGAIGLLLGRWTLDGIIAIAPATLPRLSEISLDVRIIGVAVAATVAVGVIIGLAPAFRLSRSSGSMRVHAGNSIRVTRRSPGRRVLVAAQVGMAVILTVGAALLAESLRNLINTSNGFNAERLISTDLYLRGSFKGDSNQLFRELLEAAQAVPGVNSAAISMRLPTQTAGVRAPLTIVGTPQAAIPAVLRPISPAYFETASIAIRAGRQFSATDTRSAPRVAIVNASAVREIFTDRPAVGERVTTSLTNGPLEIVGVVDDVTPAGEVDRAALYVPIDQLSIGSGYLLVRSEGDPESALPALRARLRQAAPALALDRMDLVRHSLEASRSAARFNGALAGTFALLALLLAAIGVYGLTASEVASRWRELAVRLALGASVRQVLWTVLRPCATVLLAGAMAGVAGAAALGPRLATLLYQVEPDNTLILTVAPALLATIGLAAAAMAAGRVLRADPASTLRNE
jgi:predicted permease